MPKVSVVIPAYNAMPYLPAAVESVMKQTFTDFEVLIVDDGSSDRTAEWAAQVADPRVRLVSQENQGTAGARNTGIAESQGEYIAFLDADDLWEPSKLEKQVRRLDDEPEVGLVHSWIAYVDEHGRLTSKMMTCKGEGKIWQQVVIATPVLCGSTPMVRRSCFDTLGGFDRSLPASEDWDMWIRVAWQYSFALIKEPLVRYRIHPTNKSIDYERRLKDFYLIIEKAFKDKPPELLHLKQRSYGRSYLHVATRALAIGGDPQRAAELRRKAIACDPKLRYFGLCIHLGLKLAAVKHPVLSYPISLILLGRKGLSSLRGSWISYSHALKD